MNPVARTDVSAAANTSVGRIVDYSPDPRGWSMFAALAGAHNRVLNRAPAVVESYPEHHGPMAPRQRMVGLAPLGLGAGRPVTPAGSQLSDERSDVLSNPALRIFAERLRRGQGGPLS